MVVLEPIRALNPHFALLAKHIVLVYVLERSKLCEIPRVQRFVRLINRLDVALSFFSGITGAVNVHEFLGSHSRFFAMIFAFMNIVRALVNTVIHVSEQIMEAFGMSPNPASSAGMLSSISCSETIHFAMSHCPA